MAALIGATTIPKSPKTSGFTVQIPLDLLSEDGVPPQANDSVSFSVDGTVQSADDENATVKIEAVNGQPVDESAAQEATEDAGAGAGAPPAPGSSAAMRPGLGRWRWQRRLGNVLNIIVKSKKTEGERRSSESAQAHKKHYHEREIRDGSRFGEGRDQRTDQESVRQCERLN